MRYDDDDDDDFIKRWGYGYAATNTNHDDSTLLLSALGVSSIYYTRWLSRESNRSLSVTIGRSAGRGSRDT